MTRHPPQSLGQLAAAGRSRSPEQRAQRYSLLLQTERNIERAQKNNAILEDRLFLRACKAADLQPTRRQASKWRRREGKAYREGRRQAA